MISEANANHAKKALPFTMSIMHTLVHKKLYGETYPYTRNVKEPKLRLFTTPFLKIDL